MKAMGPESKREIRPLVPASAEEHDELARALREPGEVELGPDELRRWAETGECPASLR